MRRVCILLLLVSAARADEPRDELPQFAVAGPAGFGVVSFTGTVSS